MDRIKEVSEHAEEWIHGTGLQFWANAFFTRQCYGHLTSNIAEVLNSWILDAREQPVLNMMESIRQQLMDWFQKRQEAALQQNGIVISKVQAIVEKVKDDAQRYHVIPTNDIIFEYLSENTSYIINLAEKQCTCKGWNTSGIPCAYAASALLFMCQYVHDFIDPCFTVEFYCQTYQENIFPVPNSKD